MARERWILVVVLSLLASLRTLADVGALDPLARPATRLGPGYLVNLQISINGTNEPELCGSFRLDGEGKLHLTVGFQPIDPIGIAGLTCPDAKTRIVDAIKRYYRGRLETEVGIAQIPRIQVLTEGGFARRGIVTLAEGARLTDLFTESTYLPNANLARVRVIRIGENGARPETIADYTRALEGRVDDPVNDPALRHGDRVILDMRPITRKESFIVVHGEVRKAGKTPYFAGMTVKDALKAADGLLDTADTDKVTIYRAKDQSTSTVSAERAMKGIIVDDLELGPGDAVMVHRADSGLRYAVLGSVVTPQTFRWKGKVTLSKAIADAGGFRPDADRGKVTILRNMLADPAQAVPITLNFDLIARGQQPDPELDPGTVITVPQRVRPNNHLLDLGFFLLRLLVF